MNGLLINSGEASVKNIGDYIQSVAQEQFFEHIDMYIEREALNTYQTDDAINVIMNGWFMRHPENYPPSKCINPCYVSFHIAPKISERLLTEETIRHFKKYEPIGCRDFGTMKLLMDKGIKSFFSGCLTMTLGLKYKCEEKDDVVYFVDPYYELGCGNFGKIRSVTVKSLWLLLKHFRKAWIIHRGFQPEFYSKFLKFSKTLHKLVMSASFYHSYCSIFSDDILLNARFINHQVSQKDFRNDDEKMEYARELVRKYARARLVVTSRIHCALPCLGVETPVLFVNSRNLEDGGLRSSGRFDGLIEFLNVLRWTPNGVKVETPEIGELLKGRKISRDTIEELTNKADYKYYRDNLIKKVKTWLRISL